MALVLSDRVLETCTSPGTGAVTLLGAVTGYQSFSAGVGNANTCYYTIADQTGANWEVGLGTYASSGNTLTRTTVLSSSNSGSTVNFATGTQNVFVTYPSSKSVYGDSTVLTAPSGALLPVANGGTGLASLTTGYIPFGAGTSAFGSSANLFWDNTNGRLGLGTTTPAFAIDVYDQNNATFGFREFSAADGPTIRLYRAQGTIASPTPPTTGQSLGGLRSFGYTGAAFGTLSAAIDLYANQTFAVGSQGSYINFRTTADSTASATEKMRIFGSGGVSIGNTTDPGATNLSVTGALTLGTALSVGNGGTGRTSVTTNLIPYGNGTSALQVSNNLEFDGTTLILGPGSTLGGTTNPYLAVTGNANGYIQQYIYNASSGTSASADFVAYPDNGLDTSGWIDMGIGSSTYNDAAYSVTGPNEGYIFMSSPSGASKSGNLVYATDSTGTTNSHQWYVGGFTAAKGAWKMQLTSTGLQLANALGTAYGGTNVTSSGASGNLLASDGTNWTSSTAASLSIPTYTSTVTLTNKRVTPRIGTTTSASTITPTADASDQYNVTALATTASFAIPSGTPTNGQKLTIRIYAGTTQTISWVTTAGGYRVIGTTLPTSVPATKTIYVGCVYNAADSFWDVVAVATQA
jgi:hypothetical protein